MTRKILSIAFVIGLILFIAGNANTEELCTRDIKKDIINTETVLEEDLANIIEMEKERKNKRPEEWDKFKQLELDFKIITAANLKNTLDIQKELLQTLQNAAEIFYLKGCLQEVKLNDNEAFFSYTRVLELNPDHIEAKEAILRLEQKMDIR